jgi:hypothetical protein
MHATVLRSPKRVGTAVLAAILLLGAVASGLAVQATKAGAATVATPNICFWPDGAFHVGNGEGITLSGTATPGPAAGQVTLGAFTGTMTIPGFYLEAAASQGNLNIGANSIPVTAHIAIDGTTSAGAVTPTRQVLQGTATATVTVSQVAGVFDAADTPVTLNFPASTWSTSGTAPIDFKQAVGEFPVTGAATGPLVGAPGLPTPPTGLQGASVLIRSALSGPSGNAIIYTQCQPGNIDVASGGQPYQITTITPFASATPQGGTGPGPGPEPGAAIPVDHTCLSGLGSQFTVSAATATAPRVTRELQGVSLTLARYGSTNPTSTAYNTVNTALAATNPGIPVNLTNMRANITIAPQTLIDLYRANAEGTTLLDLEGASEFKTYVWVALAGANTVEGVQTVAVETTWKPVIHDPTPASKNSGDETAEPLTIVAPLPATSWKPTGAGPVTWSEAPAGSMSTIGVLGKGEGNNPYFIKPYGSVFVRGETKLYAANLDCVVGANSVAINSLLGDESPGSLPAGFTHLTAAQYPTECDAVANTAGVQVPNYSNFGLGGGTGPTASRPSQNATGSGPRPVTIAGAEFLCPGRYTVTEGAAPVVVNGTPSATPPAAGSAYEVITGNVVAGPKTIAVAGQLVVMPNVRLNGQDQVVRGALKQVTVFNGDSGVPWSVTGQMSDLTGTGGTIPGGNLGWIPSAAVAPGAPGPAATVTPGAPTSDAAKPWLDGGLAAPGKTLCSSSSPGAFTCDASLLLGVPATAGIGTYTGILTLTLT